MGWLGRAKSIETLAVAATSIAVFWVISDNGQRNSAA